MGALLVTMLLAASDVSLSVAPGVVCVDQARLAARLERQGVQVRAKSERLAVSIELVAANVVVRGVKPGGGVLERSVPAKVDDCAAIERVIAAMITSWSKSPLPREGQGEGERRDAGSPLPRGEGQGEGERRDAGSPLPRGEGQDEGERPSSTSTPEITVATPSDRAMRDAGVIVTTSAAPREISLTNPLPEGEGAVAKISSADGGGAISLTPNPLPEGEGAVAIISSVDGGAISLTPNPLPEGEGAVAIISSADGGAISLTPNPLPENTTALEIAALGGTALGPTASFTGRGQASVALAFSRFGLSLDVGLESARARTIDPVTVTSTSQWASLNGLVHFRPFDRVRFSLSLGARVWRIAAETTGADDNATTALASFGGVAAGTATIRLIGPLSAQLNLYASSRWRAERFNVANLGAVLELLPWEGGLLGGLMLEANFL